ncbi:MAG: bifunctional molybdenum cofactor biosynthesis protein MoaC/MoaB [Chitinophagales bacterium]
MVNITAKSESLRQAIASAIITVSKPETIAAVLKHQVPKGDPFEFSRAAGLLAIKQTSAMIPDCHPLPIEYAAITHRVEGLQIFITVEVHTIYKTGVEVEAMHGAAITALTIYDMLKPLDKGIEISSIKLVEKKGGKSDIKYKYPDSVRCAVITCSDSVAKGTNPDISGDTIVEKLKQHKVTVSFREAIPDDFKTIQAKTRQLVADAYQLIVFTGGTGLSPRDVTPDAVSELLDRDIPGLMEAARAYGQQSRGTRKLKWITLWYLVLQHSGNCFWL